jgi:ABC-type Mn2+/Zn2+ transport system permease subunit
MYPSVFPAVITLGMMPALVVGIGVGYLAAESTARSIAWRRRMMAAPAIAGVALLGIAFGLQVIVPLAAIPTVVGVLVLERATREPDELPVAAARVRW